MSFSADCKTELCRVPIQEACCAQAELYGALLLGRLFTDAEVCIHTGHPAFQRRLERLLDAAFGLRFHTQPVGRKVAFRLTPEDGLTRLLDVYGHDRALRLSVHLNRAVMAERECCMASFVRGTFLTGGFVAAPEDKYHLELVTPHLYLARELTALLGDLQLPPKVMGQEGRRLLYYKASESIEDFLTLCGAPLSALSLMEAKVEKDVRNRINRKVNCETANSAKTVRAAVRQVEYLETLRATSLWDELPESLRLTAQARIDHSEDTLSELAERLEISKSGLNHRLRKLMESTPNDE